MTGGGQVHKSSFGLKKEWWWWGIGWGHGATVGCHGVPWGGGSVERYEARRRDKTLAKGGAVMAGQANGALVAVLLVKSGD